MSKLRLDLDALEVQSFETAAPAGERGTVRGNAELIGIEPEPLSFTLPECGPVSGAESCKGTCITCAAPTDPCLCDPIQPL